MNGGKRKKMPKKPKTTKIHGKKVATGKGVGKRVAKKAKSAIQLRKERMKKELGYS